jgi:hypothetical protein
MKPSMAEVIRLYSFLSAVDSCTVIQNTVRSLGSTNAHDIYASPMIALLNIF